MGLSGGLQPTNPRLRPNRSRRDFSCLTPTAGDHAPRDRWPDGYKGRHVTETGTTGRTAKIDKASDLALLKVDAITPFVYLSHSNGVDWYGRHNDGVSTGSVLGITPGYRGIVSSERGMRDEASPVQCRGRRGSGRPLIGPGDGGRSSSLKLDAIKMSKTTSDLPRMSTLRPRVRSDQVSRGHAGIPSTRRLNPRAQIDPFSCTTSSDRLSFLS